MPLLLIVVCAAGAGRLGTAVRDRAVRVQNSAYYAQNYAHSNSSPLYYD